MKKMTQYIVVLFFIFFFVSLFTPHSGFAKKISQEQARVLQSKDFEAPYNRVFKTTMSVLQDNNFLIDAANYDAGLIHAQTGSKPGFGITKKVLLTANLEKITDSRTSLRINLMLNKSSSTIFLLGGASQSESGKPLDNPEIYQRLFSAIEKGIFIRRELSK